MYREQIQLIAPLHNARHIEAFMRLEHSTLDGLSKAQFRREVLLCAKCVDEAGEAMAETLAKSIVGAS